MAIRGKRPRYTIELNSKYKKENERFIDKEQGGVSVDVKSLGRNIRDGWILVKQTEQCSC